LRQISHFTKIRQSAGCSGVRSGVPEYRVSLLVAEKVAALLQSCGATVVMSRTTNDVWLFQHRARGIDEPERRRIVDQAPLQRVHGHGALRRQRTHALPDYNARYIRTKAVYLSECIGGAFGEATDAGEVQLVPLENQTGFNWSRIPVVALEMGYLTNAREDALLNSDAFQMRCALG